MAMMAVVGPAAAQVAASSGARVVVDPETRRARVISPFDARNAYDYAPPEIQEPIILKKPKPRKPKPAAPKVAETPAEPASEPPRSEAPASASLNSLSAEDYVSPFEAAPEPPRKKAAEKPKPKAVPEPKAESSPSIPFSFGGQDDLSYAAPPAQKAAKAEPNAKPKAANNGTARNIHVNFTPGAAEPTAEVATALQSLAGDLTNELQEKSGRLLLQAFAGSPGDKSSEARRLSLKRALAVRQLLIDSGVPSDKIEVRAMGGATDGGTPDRVDVMLRG